MNILLTYAGNRDPFNDEVVQGNYSDGPVLTLLAERTFDRIYFFSTPNTLPNTQELHKEANDRFPQTECRIHHINIPDPTDYEALFLRMADNCRAILEENKARAVIYWIATASGTPQMQTIWFLLAQSGLFPATLLKITPRKFLKTGQKAVSEISIPLEHFPIIALPEQAETILAEAMLRKEKLEAERADIVREFGKYAIVGRSAAWECVASAIEAAARYDSSVLIEGETGTGKELVARAIHFNSERKTEPFIVVNCAAIPDALVESELFGFERGAFTGASQQRKGKFELADGGTLFLDEVGEMPLSAQPKILRVLQEREVTRLGGATPIPANVRIIAATNRDLSAEIQHKTFREDLYYRLKVIDIRTPALRERREDIPLLAEHFLSQCNERYHQRKQFSREAMRRIVDHVWPGNIRQLENAVERAFVLSRGAVIRESDLPPGVRNDPSEAFNHLDNLSRLQAGMPLPPEGLDLSNALCSLERSYYEEAIRLKAGNREAAARHLGVKPHTFRKRAREKFGL